VYTEVQLICVLNSGQYSLDKFVDVITAGKTSEGLRTDLLQYVRFSFAHSGVSASSKTRETCGQIEELLRSSVLNHTKPFDGTSTCVINLGLGRFAHLILERK
jgi:hypothetical protein